MPDRRTLQLHPRLPTAPTAGEIDVLARTIYGEARGEPLLGRIAVAWAILNRARADIAADGKPDWWGEGIIGVACKPWQFSCWNANDPNLPKLRAVTFDDNAFRECYVVAVCTAKVAADGDYALAPLFGDPTDGAVSYLTAVLYRSNPPKWASGRLPDASIGAHVFFKEVF